MVTKEVIDKLNEKNRAGVSPREIIDGLLKSTYESDSKIEGQKIAWTFLLYGIALGVVGNLIASLVDNAVRSSKLEYPVWYLFVLLGILVVLGIFIHHNFKMIEEERTYNEHLRSDINDVFKGKKKVVFDPPV